jgi:2-polyprenyl-3-methyl-5-hydroxy-6-metoxy-1,4-benzoquinol methylase
MQPPLPNTPSAHRARQLIAAGPAGWRLGRFGRPGRVLGRIAARLSRGSTPYQQEVDRGLLEAVGHVDARVDVIIARLDASDGSAARTQVALQRRLDSGDQIVDDLVQAGEALRASIAGTQARIGDPHQRPRLEDLLSASRQRPYVAEPGFSTWDEPRAGLVMGYAAASLKDATDTERYKLFEDRFRGPEERVRSLQRLYLPLLGGSAPVLDLGCGRGEMLDLLRESGIAYRGVDIDEAMIGRCVAKGHADVEVADASEHLRAVPDGHYGAIFCAQVIEHLPYAELGELLRLAERKLRPGGMLIAETVNPHAPHALRAFWTDLTHQHPIFPEVALTLCELAGFAVAYVFHPTGTGDVEADSWTESAYAVVARTHTTTTTY